MACVVALKSRACLRAWIVTVSFRWQNSVRGHHGAVTEGQPGKPRSPVPPIPRSPGSPIFVPVPQTAGKHGKPGLPTFPGDGTVPGDSPPSHPSDRGRSADRGCGRRGRCGGVARPERNAPLPSGRMISATERGKNRVLGSWTRARRRVVKGFGTRVEISGRTKTASRREKRLVKEDDGDRESPRVLEEDSYRCWKRVWKDAAFPFLQGMEMPRDDSMRWSRLPSPIFSAFMYCSKASKTSDSHECSRAAVTYSWSLFSLIQNFLRED